MDNAGGLNKLYYVDGDDFISAVEGDDGLFEIALEEGAVLHEIEFTEDTGRISESEEMTYNGLIHNFEITCKIRKCGPSNSDLFGDLCEKKLILLARDNNDNNWLVGDPGTYFNITTGKDTGANFADLNNIQLKISAQLAQPAKFTSSVL